MKVLGIGLSLGLVLVGVARADDDLDNSKHWIAPKFETLHAQWPRGTDGRWLYGIVDLECGTDAKGYAADCTVTSTRPTDRRLAQAAPALAHLYRARDRRQGRVGLALDLQFDTPPDWLKKPTLAATMAVFPVEAKGVGGRATIQCIVKTDGLLRACKVESEEPKGRGFGAAALTLAPTFLMKPAIKEGKPIETPVTIPIDLGYGATVSTSGRAYRIMTSPAWAKTPTVSEILAELDKKVGDKFADGKVTFQCTISKQTGRLSDCVTVTVGPGMSGFTGAAEALTGKFEADTTFLANEKADVRVNLAFSFPDMQSETWSKRYLAHVDWLRTVSPDPNQPLFPEAAEKAGLKTGKATVDCVLAASGALTNCAVLSESTPGVGFGELATKIAEVFVANPWTEDGLPADGAHVRLPIEMNYVPPPANAPPAPAPTPATKP